MTLRIRPVNGVPRAFGYSVGSSALDLSDEGWIVLTFEIEVSSVTDLEALCHARRSMLREERTMGREGDEPSLEEAVFSRVEIAWKVRPEQRTWCLRKLDELIERAGRVQGIEGA